MNFFNGKTSSTPGDAPSGSPLPGWLEKLRKLPKWVQYGGGFLLVAISIFLLATSGSAAAKGVDGGINSPTNSLIMVFDVMIKLSVVVVLIFLSAIVYRRWQGKPAVSGQKQLTLLETLPLGPKRVLHVVKAGDQTLLIGATDQSIQLISTLKSSGQSELANNAPQAQAVSFASLLDSAQNQPQEPLP